MLVLALIRVVITVQKLLSLSAYHWSPCLRRCPVPARYARVIVHGIFTIREKAVKGRLVKFVLNAFEFTRLSKFVRTMVSLDILLFLLKLQKWSYHLLFCVFVQNKITRQVSGIRDDMIATVLGGGNLLLPIAGLCYDECRNLKYVVANAWH